jgi:hypothetical protein
MSDLPTLTPPSDDGQAAQASEQASEKQEDSKAAEADNIRKLQSSYDKQIAQIRKENQQVQQQYNQQAQLNQQLQQRLQEQMYAAAPDDYTRLELQLKDAQATAQQYYNAYNQAIQDKQEEQERINSLSEIAGEFGVTLKDLEAATDYKSAVKLAVAAQAKQSKAKQDTDNDKSSRNMPDLGGGAPRTASTQAEAEWERLVKSKDSIGQTRWLREHGGKTP